MEHTIQHTGIEKDVSSETTLATKSPLGLMQIPVELRNDIYDYTLPELEELVIPNDFKGSALDYISQQLDPSLCLNQQIHDEATMALLRRTMFNAKKIEIPDPTTLSLQLPSNMVFKQVHHVEITMPQGGSPDPLSPPTAPFGIHDALARCPNVRVLHINVSAGMLVTKDKQTGQLRLQTMNEIEEVMRFDRILDSKHLHTIQLFSYDSPRIAPTVGCSYSTFFDDFASWMWQKFVERRRKISFNVKICPSPDKGKFSWIAYYQRVWTTRGHVTYYHQVDFFG